MRIFLLFVMSIVVSVSAFAQGEPCLPDCPNDTWSLAYPAPAYTCGFTLPLCGNNLILVSYRYRTADCFPLELYHDIYIEKIEFDGFDRQAYLNCIAAYGGLAGYVDAVTKELLKQNPSCIGIIDQYCPDPPPIPNYISCNDSWKVM